MSIYGIPPTYPYMVCYLHAIYGILPKLYGYVRTDLVPEHVTARHRVHGEPAVTNGNASHVSVCAVLCYVRVVLIKPRL